LPENGRTSPLDGALDQTFGELAQLEAQPLFEADGPKIWPVLDKAKGADPNLLVVISFCS
jgi:hypothetical protein